VTLKTPHAERLLARGNRYGLAMAYLAEEIDVAGDFDVLFELTDLLPRPSTWWHTVLLWLRLNGLPGRGGWTRRAIAFHYDRPVEFFLPWFDRWRSYSQGVYVTPNEPLDVAQARKLEQVFDALELRPGMTVLDVGTGWGSFLEFAAQRGV